jgi:hypothetical protein
MYGGFVHPIVLLSRASSVITMACTPWLAIIMKSDHACMLLYASSLDWHFFMVYRSKQKKRAPSQWTISITSWLIRKLCYNLLWSRTVPACINCMHKPWWDHASHYHLVDEAPCFRKVMTYGDFLMYQVLYGEQPWSPTLM